MHNYKRQKSAARYTWNNKDQYIRGAGWMNSYMKHADIFTYKSPESSEAVLLFPSNKTCIYDFVLPSDRLGATNIFQL